MVKQGEKEYFRNIGQEGITHSINKPYSDDKCAEYLMEIGLIMGLLPSPPARLLDLGCGTGWTSFFFARRGYSVTGQDISADAIDCANKTKVRELLGEAPTFIECDYEQMRYADEFDCAVFYDSL
ncbi:MAG: class I SAM-dependent methyltransferase, partial [Endomicrobiales bacterium]